MVNVDANHQGQPQRNGLHHDTTNAAGQEKQEKERDSLICRQGGDSENGRLGKSNKKRE